MNRGRSTLKRSVPEHDLTLEECHCIAKFISLRRSNLIKIIDARRENSLALSPARFRESIWFRRAAFTHKRRKRKRIIIRRRVRGRDMCPIPLDLVLEILIRLPANSMTRFKCVSKQWSSLISCKHFCNRLFTITRQQQPHLYMCLLNEDRKCILLSLSSTSPNNTCLVVDQDLSISGMGGFFVNVVRGLMCFSVRKMVSIYNSTTRQRLTLPAIKFDIRAEQGQNNKSIQYYIGHDPVSDQYKILCTIAMSSHWLANLRSEHWVFVLEAGGSWKKVIPLENYHLHSPDTVAQVINGSVVHYLAWVNMYTCAVVSFDIRSEELTTTLVPLEAGDVDLPAAGMKAGLIKYGGKIAVFDHTRLKDNGLVDLWIVDNARKGWSTKRLVVQPCQRHLVHDIVLIVKGTTQDNKVILAPAEMCTQFYFLCYDMRSNDLRKVEIKGVPQRWFDRECYFDLTVMDESDSIVYLKT
ncbi:hypothetical protein AALP_AA2G241500 [Arabis alpina]|uniref:F-box domain-containing protein n=1 Tax=Arabis alpina TaxID=50452 RepID=A0A087HJM3_ARAAL|nr:hypothetical protein AALP_AA2G241500 [Arabis alpina]